MMPPLTPLLAGIPTALTQSPAASYIPHVVITARTCSTSEGSSTWPPVRGWRPPLARVAAMSARSRVSTAMEHCRTYCSSTGSGSPSRIPNSRSMWAIARLRWALPSSDSKTASSTSSPRPAKAPNQSSARAKRSCPVSPATSEVAVMAPALIIGFFGRPVSGARLISLKASPEGSTSTLRATASSPWSCSPSA